MARLAVPLALLALALAPAAAAEPASEALPLDDACSSDATAEECSASFRQLRGLQVHAAEGSASKQAPEEDEPDQDEPDQDEPEQDDEEQGVCCFAADDKNDMCGTCYPTSIATDVMCSKKGNCGGCGGTWCRSVCVMGAADPSNKCGTAYDTGIAKSDSYCATDAKTCASCQGEWCLSGPKTAKNTTSSEDGDETVRSTSNGFCCYRADEDDTCGTCVDVAQDVTCSQEEACTTSCGGTWCAGPKCVIGSADPKSPCSSAFPEGGVAAAGSFCAISEDHCSSCSGSWCPDASIKYAGSGSDDAPQSDPEPSEGDEPDGMDEPEQKSDQKETEDGGEPTDDGDAEDEEPDKEDAPEPEDPEGFPNDYYDLGAAPH